MAVNVLNNKLGLIFLHVQLGTKVFGKTYFEYKKYNTVSTLFVFYSKYVCSKTFGPNCTLINKKNLRFK